MGAKPLVENIDEYLTERVKTLSLYTGRIMKMQRRQLEKLRIFHLERAPIPTERAQQNRRRIYCSGTKENSMAFEDTGAPWGQAMNTHALFSLLDTLYDDAWPMFGPASSNHVA